MTIAIIGAGLAGLSCADALSAAGQSVVLFDKGRGPGGRMSTRRAQTPVGECRFDHGAQYFTPTSPDFAAETERWIAAGAAAPWTGDFVTISPSGDITPAPDAPRYVGTPSMNAIIRHLAAGHAVQWARRVSSIRGTPGARTLHFEDDTREGPFEAVIVAVPAEQASDLLTGCAPTLAAEAAAIQSAPCWAVMLAFDTGLDAPYDAAQFSEGPIAWAARNASKPGRDGQETWVLHASADWSRHHLEDRADTVAAALTEAFAPPVEPDYAAAHRWRYSQIITPAPTPAAWDKAAGIGVCGDWRCGPTLEDAWRSGRALAAQRL
ncbi:MAG: FAD-dependent oxidoreductase [Pseudomonadota bacterium]